MSEVSEIVMAAIALGALMAPVVTAYYLKHIDGRLAAVTRSNLRLTRKVGRLPCVKK